MYARGRPQPDHQRRPHRASDALLGRQDVRAQGLPEEQVLRPGYGDIEWGGQVSAAWYVHLTDSSEGTIANWLKSMGWNVILIDERDDDDE